MSWWYISGGERRGPVNEDELSRLLINGALTPDSLLWKSGMKGWEPAANIVDLSTLLSSLPPEFPLDQLPKRTAWQGQKRHLGSTFALIVGGLSLVSGLAKVATTQPANNFEPGSSVLQAGVVIILGALAYRSAKKRRIGEVKPTWTRQFMEVTSLVLICLVISLQNNLKYLTATDPVPNVLIPIWAILAYLIVVVVPKRWLRRS